MTYRISIDNDDSYGASISNQEDYGNHFSERNHGHQLRFVYPVWFVYGHDTGVDL